MEMLEKVIENHKDYRIDKLHSISAELKDIQYPNDLERSKVWLWTDKMTGLACQMKGWELDGDFETAEIPYNYTNREYNLKYDGKSNSLYLGDKCLSRGYRLVMLGKLLERVCLINRFFPNGTNQELRNFIRSCADGKVVSYKTYKNGLEEYNRLLYYKESGYKNIKSVGEFSEIVNSLISKSSVTNTKTAVDIINTVLDSVKWKFSFHTGEWDEVDFKRYDEPYFLINFVLTSKLFGVETKVLIDPESATIKFCDGVTREINIRDCQEKKEIRLTKRVYKKLKGIKIV